MRLTDLLLFPVVALWQQKSRTALTTLGVVFGAFVLAASLSINQGVQETIARESHRTDSLRRIHVNPDWGGRQSKPPDETIVVEGKMSDAKRQRIREAHALHKQTAARLPPVLLTEETLGRLAALDHVQTVEPAASFHDSVVYDGQSHDATIQSARPQDLPYLRRLVAGRFFATADERSVVVSEFLLYRCGIVDDDAIASVLGKTLQIEIHSRRESRHPTLHLYLMKPDGGATTPEEAALLARLVDRLPEALGKLDLSADDVLLLQRAFEGQPAATEPVEVFAEEFTIAAVIRQVTAEESKERRWWDDLGGGADVFLPYQTAAGFFFRAANYFSVSSTNRAAGVNSTLLIADDEQHVKQIVPQVRDMGLQAHAPIEFIERERLTWRLVFGGMTCIAAVALIVAAMGIANTMLMSVLERTREIGVMKAVGAAGSHIQAMFLIEGGLVGTAGGCLGLVLAWGASIPGDAWVRSMVERDMSVKLTDKLFIFPPWMVTTVLMFTVVVTTCAALFPARRAARVDPVAALRHE